MSHYVGTGSEKPVSGVTPDIRLPITNQPLVTLTRDLDIASKSAQIKTFVTERWVDVQYFVSGVGSSTLVDTDGDVFHKSAIDSMAKEAVDLNILLNHDPKLPWSIFGSVLETEVAFMKTGDGEEHTVLKLLTDVEPKHPDAWRTYEMIAGIDCRQRKLGFSVGCLYVDARPRQQKNGLYRGADVFDVMPVEFSVVTMPANRLAWIENVVMDLQEKGVIPIDTPYYKQKWAMKKGEFGRKDYATSQPVYEAINDWMDFGPIAGPKLERLAKAFEKQYGIHYVRMPRSA